MIILIVLFYFKKNQSMLREKDINRPEQNPVERTRFITAPKERNIWINLGLALAATPITIFIGSIILLPFWALGNAFNVAPWWAVLITGYILSLVYFFYEPRFRLYRERKKVVDALIFCWKIQLAKRNMPQLLNNGETKEMREVILERMKIWGWFDPQLLSRNFSAEKYSEFFFGIMGGIIDELIAEIGELKRAMPELTPKELYVFLKEANPKRRHELVEMYKMYKSEG